MSIYLSIYLSISIHTERERWCLQLPLHLLPPRSVLQSARESECVWERERAKDRERHTHMMPPTPSPSPAARELKRACGRR